MKLCSFVMFKPSLPDVVAKFSLCLPLILSNAKCEIWKMTLLIIKKSNIPFSQNYRLYNTTKLLFDNFSYFELSRKQISDYRRKKCLNYGGFPAPKPKEPHKPKKFDDMCRRYLKMAWELGYLPGKKHYGLLADFSGLSRKQISDWSRKYSIKLGLKGRKAVTTSFSLNQCCFFFR